MSDPSHSRASPSSSVGVSPKWNDGRSSRSRSVVGSSLSPRPEEPAGIGLSALAVATADEAVGCLYDTRLIIDKLQIRLDFVH